MASSLELDTLGMSNKGYLSYTSGDAEVSNSPGLAGAISRGGTALGLSYDDKGYNVAGAAPGESYAFSKHFPEAPSLPSLSLPTIEGPTREGLDPGSLATGAVGGAAAGAGVASACCCCGCVIQ